MCVNNYNFVLIELIMQSEFCLDINKCFLFITNVAIFSTKNKKCLSVYTIMRQKKATLLKFV